jgi:hypothetical protein
VYLERHTITLSIMRSFEEYPGFIPIYTHEIFCSEGDNRCQTHSKDSLFYTDTDHLSRDGATMVIQQIREVLERQSP